MLGPKPTVMVSEAGPRSSASPVSSGGCCGIGVASLTGSPTVNRAAMAAHRPSIRITSSTSVLVTSTVANISRFCCVVVIPACRFP